MDDDRDFSALDPANLLPYECELEPHDENVEKLPFEFQGSGNEFYTGPAAF